MKRAAEQDHQSKHEKMGTDAPMAIERLRVLVEEYQALDKKSSNTTISAEEREEAKSQMPRVLKEFEGLVVHRVHAVRCSDTFLAGAFLDRQAAESMAEEVNKMPEHQALIESKPFQACFWHDIDALMKPKTTTPHEDNIIVTVVKIGWNTTSHCHINTDGIPESEIVAFLENHKSMSKQNFVYFITRGRIKTGVYSIDDILRLGGELELALSS